MCIQPCKFVDRVDSKNIASYGYRCYDNYGSCYSNLWEKRHISMPPIEVFKKVCKERKDDPDLDIMLEYVENIKGNILIGDTRFGWEQIIDIIEK
jgi:hypothetical protein